MINEKPKQDFYKIISQMVVHHLTNEIKVENTAITFSQEEYREVEYIASINISGKLSGILCMFTSSGALEFILDNVFLLDFSVVKEDGLIQDSLNEFLNILIANSMDLLSESGIQISIDIPHKMEKDLKAEYFENIKNGLRITTPNGKFFLTLI